MQCGGADVKKRVCLQTAFSTVAAAAGVGVVSGRQAVVFFAQMQGTSWIAVAISAVVFGTLCGLTAAAARQTGEESLLKLYVRVLPGWTARIAGGMYCLTMVFAAAAMLAEAGRMAALTFPVHNAYWMGVVFTLGMALMLCVYKIRGWGMAVVCILFYTALALDTRPVRIFAEYRTEPELAGSVPAAMLLGAAHGALCTVMAAQSAFSLPAGTLWRFALTACGAMLLLLSSVNFALIRGGERLLSQPLPTVLLAARWGKAGYYSCILVKWMCVLYSLAAAIGGLTGKSRKRLKT